MDVSSPDNQLSWLEAVGLTVDEFLLTRPLTYLKQTKYNMNIVIADVDVGTSWLYI